MAFMDSVQQLMNKVKSFGGQEEGDQYTFRTAKGGSVGYRPVAAKQRAQATGHQQAVEQNMMQGATGYQSAFGAFQPQQQTGYQSVFQQPQQQTGYQSAFQPQQQTGYQSAFQPQQQTGYQSVFQQPQQQTGYQSAFQPQQQDYQQMGYQPQPAYGQQSWDAFQQPQQQTGWQSAFQPQQQGYQQGADMNQPWGQQAPQQAAPDNISYMPGSFVAEDGRAYRHVERVVHITRVSGCYDVIDFMRNMESVIINTEMITDERENQRCLDLIYGAAFTLNCTMTLIASKSIYLLSPNTVMVVPYKSIREMSDKDMSARWPAYGQESRYASRQEERRDYGYGDPYREGFRERRSNYTGRYSDTYGAYAYAR